MTKISSQAIDRVARRYAVAQGVLDPEEVLTQRIDGQALSGHIQVFLQRLIQEGQGINKRLEEGQRAVETMYKAKVPERDLESAVFQAVARTWGTDAMTPLLVRLITRGDFVT